MTQQERESLDRKVDAEIAKLIAESAHLNAMTAKVTRETGFYPLIAGSTFTLAVVAVVKIFL